MATQQQVTNLTSDSGDVPSGIGANWSRWYQVCNGALRPGERIGSTLTFELTGDRRCGAWAECREIVRTPQQVCWQFRLQGHSEWFPPHPALSRGILHYTSEQAATTPANAGTNGLVYVQIVRDALRPFADKLVAGLAKAGYAAPGTQRITGKYRTEVRFFHAEDKDHASALATHATDLLREAGHPVALKPVFVDGYDTSAKLRQFEIWIAE